jgi:hypothetical protein
VSKTEEKAIARQFERLKIQHLAQEKFKLWLAERNNPTAPPSPPPPAHEVVSPSAAAAYGHIKMPPMEFAQAAERETVLEHRRKMRAQQSSECFANPEEITEWRVFEEEERTRWAAASELLRRGIDAGHVCTACHLEPAEVENIREQIGL